MKPTREVNGAVVISVNLVDHILKLGFGGILAEGTHDGAEFFRGDLACICNACQLLCRGMTVIAQDPHGAQ